MSFRILRCNKSSCALKSDLTMIRVRNFLRREKKEKQREEESAAKARCSYDIFFILGQYLLQQLSNVSRTKSPNKFWQWFLEPIPGNEVSLSCEIVRIRRIMIIAR